MRPDLRARFRATVQRGFDRADRERREALARIQPAPRQTAQERRWVHARLVDSIFPRSRHESEP